MDDPVKGLIEALGAIVELMAAYRDRLMENGFTREEAVLLCRDFFRWHMDLAKRKGQDDDD